MKAVIIKEIGKVELITRHEQPMRLDYIKIKTVAPALNSITLFCGVVTSRVLLLEIRQACQPDIKPGDKVLGVCHRANPVCELPYDNRVTLTIIEYDLEDGSEQNLPCSKTATLLDPNQYELGGSNETESPDNYHRASTPYDSKATVPTNPTQAPFPIWFLVEVQPPVLRPGRI
ncbi:hypothetical protein MMC15_003080 [Xylographa vitiligo]|nr:hypothetical protein [Xylographa vitiligo]